MHQPQQFTPDDTSISGPTAPGAYRQPDGAAPGQGVRPLVLPPDTNAEKFEEYVRRAAEIVGRDNVTIISAESELTKYSYLDPSKCSDMFWIMEKDYFICSAVIAPTSVPEVQALMKLANEFDIPVWPFSIGRNLGYGGAAPRVRGSVGMDMGRNMKKILKVDVDGAYAVVEPGVTYFDLANYLEEKNLRDRVWLDCPDLGGGSILGNTIERGVGYTPYGDHWMMHCGMEMVLPTGELWRSGMGGMPNPNADQNAPPHEQEPNECWQLFNYGFGPYHDGSFSQSSLGVCVKMGIWLMTNPGGYQSYMITFPKQEDIHQVVEILRPLRVGMVLQNVPTLRNIIMDAAVHATKKDYFPDKPSDELLTDDELEYLKKKHNLGYWNFYGAVYGPPPVREALLGAIKGSFLQVPGSKFYFKEDMPDNSVLQTRDKTLQGIPSIDELTWVDWRPNGTHIAFSPIAPVSGKDALAQFEMTNRLSRKYGFDIIADFIIGMREMHHIVELVFDRTDPESRRKVHQCIKEMIDEGAAKGWGEYRTHLAIMDQVAGTYNFNNNINMKLNETIKDAVDPKGILAPGKNGVWPKKYRENIEMWRVPLPN